VPRPAKVILDDAAAPAASSVADPALETVNQE
jgi:hypothetical protein